jgi:hypothetical protein
MNRAIQFETVVDGDIIRIPVQYRGQVPASVRVTLMPADEIRLGFRPKTRDRPSGIDEFPALLDTRGWKFDREEANERH